MVDRFWEVDAARGIAVLLMVLFNWSFTLRFFNVFAVAPGSWWYWEVFPRFIAFTFLFIVGAALTLSFHRFQMRRDWERRAPVKYGKRGVKIFGYGLAITLLTYVFDPGMTVFFGILHLIGVSIVLAYPFIGRPWQSLVAALGVFVLTPVVSSIPVSVEVLAALGFSVPVSTFDLFPLLPWFGVVLLGVTAGHVLYPGGRRRVPVPDTYRSVVLENTRQGLSWLGRYSLEIYLTHQPVLLFGLWVWSAVLV